MKPDTETSPMTDCTENEIIRRITLKMSHLFSMKEKQRQVIGEFLNSEVLNFNAPSESVARYGLTYSIGVIGAFAGTVLLNLEESLARKVARVLFGSADAVSDEDLHAAMQELLNIFGGHLATAFNELGIDFDITTPRHTEDNFLEIRDARKVLFRFSSEGRILQFVLALQKKTAELSHA